ncbi:MAG: hypothetical protein WC494_02180 [Candidatus Pacearchaeota archaeon]
MKPQKSSFRTRVRNTLAGILIGASSLANPLQASDKPLTTMMNTEISYTEGNGIFRVRPFVYTAPSENQRTEVMMGRKFGDFTLYGHFKADNQENTWAGIRMDYGKKFLDEKLSLNAQVRLFSGLTEGTGDQAYFIPSGDYKINSWLKAGFLGYAVKTEEKEPFFYLGPSATIQLADNLSFLASYDKDVLGNYGDLAYLCLSYKIGVKK